MRAGTFLLLVALTAQLAVANQPRLTEIQELLRTAEREDAARAVGLLERAEALAGGRRAALLAVADAAMRRARPGKASAEVSVALWKLALRIRRHHAPGGLLEAETLRALGLHQLSGGNLKEAQNYLSRLLHIRAQRSPGSFDHSEAHQLLGSAYFWDVPRTPDTLAIAQRRLDATGEILRRTKSHHVALHWNALEAHSCRSVRKGGAPLSPAESHVDDVILMQAEWLAREANRGPAAFLRWDPGNFFNFLGREDLMLAMHGLRTPAFALRLSRAFDRILLAVDRFPIAERQVWREPTLRAYRYHGAPAALRKAESRLAARLTSDRRDLERATAALRARLAADPGRLRAVVELASLLHRAGSTREALDLLTAHMQLGLRRAPGKDELGAMPDLVPLVEAACRNPRHPGAEGLVDHTLALAEKLWSLPGVHPMPVTELARLSRDEGRLEEWSVWSERAGDRGALGIARWLLGDQLGARRIFREAGSLGGLAWVANTEGKPEVERELLTRTTAGAFVDPASFWVTGPLRQLAGLHRSLGDHAEARRCLSRALQIGERWEALDHSVGGELPVFVYQARTLVALANLEHSQGNVSAARTLLSRAESYERRVVRREAGMAPELGRLGLEATLLDEDGRPDAAAEVARRILDSSPSLDHRIRARRRLAALLLAAGKESEAAKYLREASSLEAGMRRLQKLDSMGSVVRPQIRYVGPADNQDVSGDRVELQLLFLSPLPVRRYRVWLNGRLFGPAEGFELPAPDERGQVLDRGRVLDRGQVLDRGRVLDRAEGRQSAARELPEELATLVRDRRYSHMLQLRHTLPLEPTDGEFVRIAVQVETTGGSTSDRELLRIRRPQSEHVRGSLRVLTVGVNDYQNLPKLRYAAADARDLAGAFRNQTGAGTLYSGAQVTSLTDGEATLANIRQGLEQLANNVRPGDTIILALSGHGVRVGPSVASYAGMSLSTMLALSPPQAKFYFAPVRFDPQNPEGTGLPWSEVLAKLDVVRKSAKAVWILADCCRAAPGLRMESVATARDLKRGIDEGGNLILCAASEGDNPSYESEDLKHGIFTHAWLETLSGKGPEIVYEDRPLGRVLTLSGLQFAVDFAVRRSARRVGVRQQVEFPRLEGSFNGGQPVFVSSVRAE